MSEERLILSPKFKAYLRCNAPVEFLEGTTAAGKTTVGIFKFILRVADSPKKLHILAAKDVGTAEKNIINKDLGIIDDFGELTEYNGNGTKNDRLSHIVLHASKGDKIIYVMGYDNKAQWKRALGGQYGCLYIDEINTADMEFVRESAMRCDYLMATLNPDDPSLPIYSEYINHSRPLPEWQQDTPKEILDELTEEPKPGWVHWFFSFADNAALSREKLELIIRNVPKGTKLYKNKIQGLRGKATGLVFSNFDYRLHVKPKAWAKRFLRNTDEYNGTDRTEWFTTFSGALDTSYSTKSADTIAATFYGITNKGRCICLAEDVYNNADMSRPFAPSDTVKRFVLFLELCRRDWDLSRTVFIDSADQATITEAEKFKHETGCIYEFTPSYKKMPIVDRINLQLGWFAQRIGADPVYCIVDTCKEYIHELDTYSWDEEKVNTPEDGHDHCVNSSQYAWLPYKGIIGMDRK